MMILCDIGNTSVDWCREGAMDKEPSVGFDPCRYVEDIYYICVNSKIRPFIDGLSNWHDASQFIDRENYYSTMGIDRIMVCEAVENGIIVDAGSAITVDRMRNGKYEGGFISLGIKAAQEAYARLSPALAQSFNFEVDLDKMAKNTSDAITIGFLAPLLHEIRSFGGPIYVTGGDSLIIASYIKEAIIDDALIFKGMEKLIRKGKTC